MRKMLKLNTKLQRLTLSWNGIEAAAVIDLLTSVTNDLSSNVCAPLSHLDLSSNSFAVYAGSITPAQTEQMSLLKASASTWGLHVRLGHIYGFGST